MDKNTFKSSFFRLLEEDVTGLSAEQKIKFMKKWIRYFEQKNQPSKNVSSISNHTDSQRRSIEILNIDSTEKIGIIVRTTLKKMVSAHLLTPEHVRLLQDGKYCKNTFDINYPFLKKVVFSKPILDQRKINGYDRYWAKVININQERYLVCNDWYERNKSKFINWVSGQINR